VKPTTTGRAIELIARTLQGEPARDVVLQPSSYPRLQELGDVGAISPDEPIVPIKKVLVEAPPRPAMAKLVAEVRALADTPEWVAKLSDEQIALIVDEADQLRSGAPARPPDAAGPCTLANRSSYTRRNSSRCCATRRKSGVSRACLGL